MATTERFSAKPAARIRQVKESGAQLHLELSGKKAIAFYRFQGIQAERTYTNFEDKPRFDEVDELAVRYINGYIKGQYDRVEVVYMKFLSASRQAVVTETLLPLSTVPGQDSGKAAQPAAAAAKKQTVEYEFLPGAADILEEILPVSFKVRLFKCFLDAAVSEQIARRVAMKAATENAGDMIKSLTRLYNRAGRHRLPKKSRK